MVGVGVGFGEGTPLIVGVDTGGSVAGGLVNFDLEPNEVSSANGEGW